METFFHTLPKGRIAEEYRRHDKADVIADAKRLAQRTGKGFYVMQAIAFVEPDFDKLPQKFPTKVTECESQ